MFIKKYFSKEILIILFLIFNLYLPFKKIYGFFIKNLIICSLKKTHPCHVNSFKYISSPLYRAYGAHTGYYFANYIINKYYIYDKYSSPTFYTAPWENGVHILLDGFRTNTLRIKNEYLIMNVNTLLEYENKNLNLPSVVEFKSDNVNIHGFFLDLKNKSSETIIKFNNSTNIEINTNLLINCQDILINNRIFQSHNHDIENKNIEKIKLLKNCYYYELNNNEKLNYTLKLKKINLIDLNNINQILFFGNNLPMKPYVVLERSNNYNYFYAKNIN
jgi:hypothetical protein